MPTRTEVLPLVVADMEARIAKGSAEYGEPLTSHNGRDFLWDAYEEALDLALYLRGAIAERDDVYRMKEDSEAHSETVIAGLRTERDEALGKLADLEAYIALMDEPITQVDRRSRQP